jgi:hypothetical protein
MTLEWVVNNGEIRYVTLDNRGTWSLAVMGEEMRDTLCSPVLGIMQLIHFFLCLAVPCAESVLCYKTLPLLYMFITMCSHQPARRGASGGAAGGAGCRMCYAHHHALLIIINQSARRRLHKRRGGDGAVLRISLCVLS